MAISWRFSRVTLRSVRTLKTSEAAALLNVSPNTLRAWERRFGYPRPQRSPGQHRLYTHGEVAALRDALQDGLSISSAVSRAREGAERRHARRSSARSRPSSSTAPTPRWRPRSRCARSSARSRRCCCPSLDEIWRPPRRRAAPRGRSPPAGATSGCGARSASRRRRSARPRSSSATPRATSSTSTRPTSARCELLRRARRRPRRRPLGRGGTGLDRRAAAAPAARRGRHRREPRLRRRGRALGLRACAPPPARCRSPSSAAAERPRAHDAQRRARRDSPLAAARQVLELAEVPALEQITPAEPEPRRPHREGVPSEPASGSELTGHRARRRAPRRLFCGHCGRAPEDRRAGPADARLRALRARPAAQRAPPTSRRRARTRSSSSTARCRSARVSERAEELLGVAETEAVNEHVLNYLAPADAEGAGPENLVALLGARGVGGDGVPRRGRPPARRVRRALVGARRRLRAAERRAARPRGRTLIG